MYVCVSMVCVFCVCDCLRIVCICVVCLSTAYMLSLSYPSCTTYTHHSSHHHATTPQPLSYSADSKGVCRVGCDVCRKAREGGSSGNFMLSAATAVDRTVLVVVEGVRVW